MNELEALDKELTLKANLIDQIASKLTFQHNFEFELGTDFNDLPLHELNYSGVYFFEVYNSHGSDNISSFLTEFKDKWEVLEYKGKFVPNTKLKRLARHQLPTEWVPLYVGKAKNITTRLKGHLFMPLTRPTFAMKLSSRQNLEGLKIRVSSIKIEVANYDLIVPKIESHFREKYNPIIGR